ncbi:MAG: glycogen debranching enzyme, partial [Desulfobulbaceae bacterium]
MKDTLQTEIGLPRPKGALVLTGGVNFALFSRHAETVTLVIDPVSTGKEAEGSLIELPLDPSVNKTGDIWHILVRGLPKTFYYGYRLGGPYDPGGSGHNFDEGRIIIDPSAKALRPSLWGEERDCLGRIPCCLVSHEGYDWEGDRPLKTPLKDSVIYEMHVRGFTIHPSAGARHPGTFAGIVEKIPYLREIG